MRTWTWNKLPCRSVEWQIHKWNKGWDCQQSEFETTGIPPNLFGLHPTLMQLKCGWAPPLAAHFISLYSSGILGITWTTSLFFPLCCQLELSAVRQSPAASDCTHPPSHIPVPTATPACGTVSLWRCLSHFLSWIWNAIILNKAQNFKMVKSRGN